MLPQAQGVRRRAVSHALGQLGVDHAQRDRSGLERLLRYCARPLVSSKRVGLLNNETLVNHLRNPTLDGRTKLLLTPLEFLDRLFRYGSSPRGQTGTPVGAVASAGAVVAVLDPIVIACLHSPIVQRSGELRWGRFTFVRAYQARNIRLRSPSEWKGVAHEALPQARSLSRYPGACLREESRADGQVSRRVHFNYACHEG